MRKGRAELELTDTCEIQAQDCSLLGTNGGNTLHKIQYNRGADGITKLAETPSFT